MRLLATLAGTAALFLVAPVATHASFDFFEDETLNDKDAFGKEIPYTSGASRQFTATFNTSTFGVDAGEDGAGTDNVNGCLETPPVFGGRTGWARFNPDVAGKIEAKATTPGYDSILWIRSARQVEWGTTTFTEVRGRPNTCIDVNNAPGNEPFVSFQADVRAPVPGGTEDRAYYIQVGAKCAGDRTTCNPPASPGGETTVTVVFTPDDTDSDGVPDTRDACPGGRRGFVTTSGCPDTDLDSIADSQEGPGCVGQRGIAAAAPYNGCLPGPNPPDPTLGARVIVESLQGDPDNTSSASVQLLLNWPKGAIEAFADNGTRDTPLEIPLRAKVPWKLRAGTKSEARQVKVRFLGPGIDARDTDIITLDGRAPRVTGALALGSGATQSAAAARRRFSVVMNTADDAGGSGVRQIEILDRKRKRLRRITVCRKTTRCPRTASRVVAGLGRQPAYLRVTDLAGNRSKRTRVRLASARCPGKKYKVFTNKPLYDCFRLNARCRRKNPPHWGGAQPPLKCSKGRIKKR